MTGPRVGETGWWASAGSRQSAGHPGGSQWLPRGSSLAPGLPFPWPRQPRAPSGQRACGKAGQQSHPAWCWNSLYQLCWDACSDGELTPL